eukprot:TRINITY_DN10223_c0_g1_i1.p1 TRINITY_DN10223_c0_g1~~TRINITY_DN10223_c0_g1_i1.p1  ORF type:complete len:646 (-),score=122.33 TRINITY_DN10223_c0_g1_i1:105-2042(-)
MPGNWTYGSGQRPSKRVRERSASSWRERPAAVLRPRPDYVVDNADDAQDSDAPTEAAGLAPPTVKAERTEDGFPADMFEWFYSNDGEKLLVCRYWVVYPPEEGPSKEECRIAQELLRSAKALCLHILRLDAKVEQYYCDLSRPDPKRWPDATKTPISQAARVTEGDLPSVLAVGQAHRKIHRERALSLALLLTALIDDRHAQRISDDVFKTEHLEAAVNAVRNRLNKGSRSQRDLRCQGMSSHGDDDDDEDCIIVDVSPGIASTTACAGSQGAAASDAGPPSATSSWEQPIQAYARPRAARRGQVHAPSKTSDGCLRAELEASDASLRAELEAEMSACAAARGEADEERLRAAVSEDRAAREIAVAKDRAAREIAVAKDRADREIAVAKETAAIAKATADGYRSDFLKAELRAVGLQERAAQAERHRAEFLNAEVRIATLEDQAEQAGKLRKRWLNAEVRIGTLEASAAESAAYQTRFLHTEDEARSSQAAMRLTERQMESLLQDAREMKNQRDDALAESRRLQECLSKEESRLAEERVSMEESGLAEELPRRQLAPVPKAQLHQMQAALGKRALPKPQAAPVPAAKVFADLPRPLAQTVDFASSRLRLFQMAEEPPEAPPSPEQPLISGGQTPKRPKGPLRPLG